jgi:hypothetical protein
MCGGGIPIWIRVFAFFSIIAAIILITMAAKEML